MIIQKTDHFYNDSGWHFKPEAKEGRYIQYLLRCKNFSFAKIARNMNINLETVLNVTCGRRRSRRVETEIARILGHDSWNDIVMEAHLAIQGIGKPTKTQIKQAKNQEIKQRQELIKQKRAAFRGQKEAV